MSLLMDALKKAELAKRQGQNNPASIRQEPELSAPPSTLDAESGALPTIALSLDPIDAPIMTDGAPEAAKAAQAEPTPPPLSFPDLQLISAFGEEPEATPTPETAANKFEQLDAEFMAEVQQAATARTATSANLRPPEASVAKIAASDAKADGATASATGAEPHAGERPHSLREMQQQMLRDVIARSSPGDVRSPAVAPRPEPPATPGSPNASMQQAQNLFAAKQATQPPSRKGFAIAVGGFAVVAAAAIVGYFWWQLQPKSNFGSIPRPPSATTPTPPLAVAPPPTLPAKPWAAPTQAKSSPREIENAIERRREIEEPALATSSARPDKPPASSESPIRIDRSPQKLNPALARGYDAFNRNDLTQAQSEYERALKAEPYNRDALHGLAAIAQRQGQVDRAHWLFQRILEADPHDPVALSAQLGQQAQSDPTQNESRLKTLAAKQPDSAAPQFSLGSLYARQGRWSEAQTAYFRAYTADPENPDIAYNLAISLEHLRQPKLARQYYRHAIDAVQTRPASFDPAQAAARLRVLEAEGP